MAKRKFLAMVSNRSQESTPVNATEKRDVFLVLSFKRSGSIPYLIDKKIPIGLNKDYPIDILDEDIEAADLYFASIVNGKYCYLVLRSPSVDPRADASVIYWHYNIHDSKKYDWQDFSLGNLAKIRQAKSLEAH